MSKYLKILIAVVSIIGTQKRLLATDIFSLH